MVADLAKSGKSILLLGEGGSLNLGWRPPQLLLPAYSLRPRLLPAACSTQYLSTHPTCLPTCLDALCCPAGRPGVGKTTAIREISRMLADDCQRRVVIVDTSNEIGGDGDIPHPGIGRARRMQVCCLGARAGWGRPAG